ncbi:MAG: PP2C family protein-serine/threonine phosphatase [Planctomycetota bacterium]
MIKLFWDDGYAQATKQPEFEPEKYRDVLERLSRLTGTELRFEREPEQAALDVPGAAVRAGGRRTGWIVIASSSGAESRLAAETGCEVVSRMLTADRDMASMAGELVDRYEELNFLYDMAERVGAVLDEDKVCALVIEEAAWLLDCERASIMVLDPESGELSIRAAVGLPEEIPREISVKPGERISGKVFQSGSGIIVNAGDPMPAESMNLNELSEANCFLSVPLKISEEDSDQEQTLGVINLTRKRGGSAFTASDLKLVQAIAGTAATQIHNCRLINAERERQKLEHELELAAKIQLSLLPEEPLEVGRLRVGGYCRPARHVGGDLFDYWMQDGRLCVVVADVSGHDMGAALMATAMRSVIRSEAGHRSSVAGLLQQVNSALFTDLLQSELMVSAFYAEIDVESGTATYCRAGHPKPLLIQNGEHRWLDTYGLLLGLNMDGDFEQRSVQLQDGACIVLYTDGLMEAEDAERSCFGTDGVRAAALEALSHRPRRMSRQVVEAARRHTADSVLADDMTAVVVRFGEEPAGEDQ